MSGQGHFELTLAPGRAGFREEGPGLKRPIKAPDSSRNLSRVVWPTANSPLHSSPTRNAPWLGAAIEGSSRGENQRLTVFSSSAAGSRHSTTVSQVAGKPGLLLRLSYSTFARPGDRKHFWGSGDYSGDCKDLWFSRRPHLEEQFGTLGCPVHHC